MLHSLHNDTCFYSAKNWYQYNPSCQEGKNQPYLTATKHKSHKLIELSKTRSDFLGQNYSRPAFILVQFMILVIY